MVVWFLWFNFILNDIKVYAIKQRDLEHWVDFVPGKCANTSIVLVERHQNVCNQESIAWSWGWLCSWKVCKQSSKHNEEINVQNQSSRYVQILPGFIHLRRSVGGNLFFLVLQGGWIEPWYSHVWFEDWRLVSSWPRELPAMSQLLPP